MNSLGKVGFKDYAAKMSAFNSAMSYNIQNAIVGIYPEYGIDYPSALLSRGTLKNVADATINSSDAGQVDFTWTDNSGDGNALANDNAMVVVYNPTKDEAVIKKEVVSRAVGTVSVSVPASFSGDRVHSWIAFVSTDGQLVSNSAYAGSSEVQ